MISVSQRCVTLVARHQVCSELLLGKSFFVAESMLLGSKDGQSEGHEEIPLMSDYYILGKGTTCTDTYLYDAIAFSLSSMQK